jgi:hypothetical protein
MTSTQEMFAILQEQAGCRHWVRIAGPGSSSFTTALRPPPKHLQYADRETAERDAELFREQNAREVESTKRQRKHKIEPATFSVLPVKLEEAAS